MATKSNITPPPKKKDAVTEVIIPPAIDEKRISEVINKGGSTTKTIEQHPSDPEADQLKNFNIKILQSELTTINELREKRPKIRGQKRLGISLHDWLIEAVKEKIERETKKYNT
jgi:predicted metal-dependent hydrolase